MQVFPTPGPINVTVDLFIADVRIVASERSDTVVDVRPRDETRNLDIKAAERIRVACSNSQLLITGPRRFFSIGIGRREAISVTIELPAHSHLRGDIGMGEFRAEGPLGECRIKTGAGDISLDQTGALSIDTGTGNITAHRAAGDVHISTGTGAVLIGKIDGAAAIKNANGDTNIGEIGGDLHLRAANGGILIGQAHASVVAKTANGDIRINEIRRGSIVLDTACGELEVGIRKDTDVWLDVRSQYGDVRNSLAAHDGPSRAGETAEVHARTAYGDVVIRRSASP